MPPKTERIALRIAPDDLEQIRRLAEQRGMTMSEYMILASLGRQDDAGQDFQEESRLDRIERRIKRLEDLAYGLGGE